MKNLIFLLALIFSSKVFSAETDNFSFRDKKLSDSSKVINEIVNGYMQTVVAAYNKEFKNCNDEKLLEILKYKLDTNFPQIYSDLDETKEIDKSLSFNIYGGMTGVFNEIGGYYAPSINVNGVRIGIDKIDHMLSHGISYLEVFKKTNDINDALDLGIKQENGCWGLSCNKVKSYGDLAANYKGFLFWSRMLGSEKNSYIKCIDNKYVLDQKFDVAEYVDDSMDEALNCSSFASTEIAKGVKDNIVKLGFERCPVDPTKCDALIKKIPRNIALKILHPACLNPSRKDISFVETPGESVGLGFMETITNALDGVKVKNLLKGIGVK